MCFWMLSWIADRTPDVSREADNAFVYLMFTLTVPLYVGNILGI